MSETTIIALGGERNEESTIETGYRVGLRGHELSDQTNLLPLNQVITIFMGLSLCILISALDSVTVATALPTISAYFHAGSTSAWVPSAYLLTSTGFQPLYGRFSDIFGRKLTLCIAMGIYLIGSLVAGFSRSILQLVVFRGVAGVGGGGIITVCQVVISDVVSLRDRGKYQGIIGGVIAVGYAVGPLVGGALSQKVSWRWCFWITLPMAPFAMIVIFYFLPLKNVNGNMRRKLLAIDYIGSILTLIACTLILLPLIWGGVSFSWTSATVLATLISGLLVGFIFCIWEWKGANLPIVPMHIFKHSTVTGVYITMFANGFIFWSTLFYLPQFFQIVLGLSPIHSGLLLLPVLVSQVVISTIAGIAVSRTGKYRAIIYSGFSIWTVGCGLLSTLKPNSTKLVMVIYMLLSGIGAGQTLQTTTVAAQASVSRQDMSVVTAVRNFVRLMGGTLTLPVGSAIMFRVLISQFHLSSQLLMNLLILFFRNNSLRNAMTALNLPLNVVNEIIDDPSIISPHSNFTQGLGPDVRNTVLTGYLSGFRSLFILNASFAALATVAGVVLIKHKELRRPDEKRLMEEALLRSGPVETLPLTVGSK